MDKGNDGSWDAYSWPPVSFANNDHILVWWLPEYDELIGRLVSQYQWAWQGAIIRDLVPQISERTLQSWRETDPQCQQYAWYAVLDNFVIARAKQLGIRPRKPQQKTCALCLSQFFESDIPYAMVAKLDINEIDLCQNCLEPALYQTKGSSTTTREAVISLLQTLAKVLGRKPKASDLTGGLKLKGLTRQARLDVVKALGKKPTPERVKVLFGSWKTAVECAEHVPEISALTGRLQLSWVQEGAVESVTRDAAFYRSRMGPLPTLAIKGVSEISSYRDEVSSLIGTGYLALAEAALTGLVKKDPVLNDLLASVYGLTARVDDARSAASILQKHFGEDTPVWFESELIDDRTIASGPIFYEPLETFPRGGVRFVLIGGPMEYLDRRGPSTCISGATTKDGKIADTIESISRMSTLTDSVQWMQVAIETGQAIMRSLIRKNTCIGSKPFGLVECYVPSRPREAVKLFTGSFPQKISEDIWRVGQTNKSRWSYQRDAKRYVFNANEGFSLIAIDAAPAVVIWGWPDRSDICLQAFLDTIVGDSADPVTAILPDVPAFRDFARRYVRRERLTNVERAPIEDCLYRYPGYMPNKRGLVLSSEFEPRLIVYPDGSEDDGELLKSALNYVDAHHNLQVSAWDLLQDSLFRDVLLTLKTPSRTFELSAFDRKDMISWYGRLQEYENPEVLFRPRRMKLLDAVISK